MGFACERSSTQFPEEKPTARRPAPPETRTCSSFVPIRIATTTHQKVACPRDTLGGTGVVKPVGRQLVNPKPSTVVAATVAEIPAASAPSPAPLEACLISAKAPALNGKYSETCSHSFFHSSFRLVNESQLKKRVGQDSLF